jgi:hypothetical protein
MRPFAIVLLVFLLSSVLDACGGSTSPPVVRDYRGGTSPGHVTPQSLCYKNGNSYVCGGGDGSDGGTTCVYSNNKCTFTNIPQTVSTNEDLSQVTDPGVICGLLFESYDATHHACFEDNSGSGSPSYGYRQTYATYGQCDYFGNSNNRYTYDTTLNAYVLTCTAPNGGTGYWNVSGYVIWNVVYRQDLGIIQKALPSSRTFTAVFTIAPQPWTDFIVNFAESDSSGNTLGPFGNKGGGYSVGVPL